MEEQDKSKESSEDSSGLLNNVYRALITPESAFADEKVFRPKVIVLMAVSFVIFLGGSILSLQFHQNETLRTLSVAEATRRIESQFGGGSPEAKARAVESAERSLNRSGFSVFGLIGAAMGAAFRIGIAIEVWVILLIISQFAGGEESPLGRRKHRRSLCMCLYALIPLALRDLVTGFLISIRDPDSVRSVLTMAEYQAETAVNINIGAFLDLGSLPAFFRYFAANLTDPFFLWFLAVLVVGSAAVYKLKFRRALVLSGVVILVLAGQNAGVDAIQNLL